MMSWTLLVFIGAVLVLNTGAEDAGDGIPDVDIYTDNLHYRYTPKTAHPPDADQPVTEIPESWIDALSTGDLPPPDGKTSSMFVDENLALLSELGPLVAPGAGERSRPPKPQSSTKKPPRLNFKDYSLTSIAEHQRQQKLDDLLHPLHDQMVLSSDPRSTHDALHMRHAGPLCGVFQNPLFNAELRALNESAFLLRNIYINSAVRYDELRITFTGPETIVRLTLKIKESDKLLLHRKQFVLDTTKILAKLDEVTLENNFKRLSVSLNISGCRRPAAVWGPQLEETKRRVSSGPIVLHTANLMVLKGFTYPGTCSAAYFWAGTGDNPQKGFQIPTIDGSLDPLRVFQNEDVMLKLPDLATFYDLDYVGVYCPEMGQMIGQHTFKSSIRKEIVLPPASTTDDRIVYLRARL